MQEWDAFACWFKKKPGGSWQVACTAMLIDIWECQLQSLFTARDNDPQHGYMNVLYTCMSHLPIIDSDQTSLTFWLVKAFHLLCIALPTICCKLIGIMTNQARVNCQVTRVMVCCFHFLKLPLFQWPFVPRNVYRLRYTEASCPERLYLSGFCWAVAFLPSITPCNIANSWSWMLWCLTV